MFGKVVDTICGTQLAFIERAVPDKRSVFPDLAVYGRDSSLIAQEVEMKVSQSSRSLLVILTLCACRL
jgi:hypothetical protein